MSPNTTSVRKIQTPGLTAQDIKLIAIISMLLDHIGYAILIRLPGMANLTSATNSVYSILRCLGRPAFPIYCFMLVEGIMHTRSPLKYAARMLGFAIVSEIPFDLAFYGTPLWKDHQNVYWTLLLGVLMLWAFKTLDEKGTGPVPKLLLKILPLIIVPGYAFWRTRNTLIHKSLSFPLPQVVLYWAAGVITLIVVFALINYIYREYSERTALILCADLIITSVTALIADLCKTDYRSAGIIAIAAMYMFKKNDIDRIISGGVVLTLLSHPIEIASVLAIPFISRYNHERGRGMKYLFYLFYPAHLIILYLIARLLGLWVVPEVI